MRILAIDTATESCSAALLIDEHLLQREQLLERGHAEAILPMVDGLLAEAGVSLATLTAIAFGRGPGAFTGVRLAASVTQGLAFGAGLPVVPVSDLRALAQRALDSEAAIGAVLACADARMHEVYWGCFDRADDGLARAVGEERVTRPTGVQLPPSWSTAGRSGGVSSPLAPRAGPERVAAVGSGLAAYPQLRAELPVDVVLERLLPRAVEVARLAVPEVFAGRFLPAEQALPVYLRDDVVRVPPRAS